MIIINDNPTINQRYIPHDINTRLYAVIAYQNGWKAAVVCRKYHISKASLSRWIKRYNGTKESLADKSHKPLTPHPNAHTQQEIIWIDNYLRRNKNITLCELWYKLKIDKGYTRHPASLYRFLRKSGLYKQINTDTKKSYIPKPYDTPTELGVKWQMDVKYVPGECRAKTISRTSNFFQYTCIDEASRERYIYHYTEQIPANTVDFVKRCIRYFGYKPKEIQTDNGIEFTYFKATVKVIHPLDQLCMELNIYHHRIRPRTPRHNGKVERSHRNDNERFYKTLTFYSLEDLRYQAAHYLKRSNNIPMAVLNYKTPKEQRQLLLKYKLI